MTKSYKKKKFDSGEFELEVSDRDKDGANEETPKEEKLPSVGPIELFKYSDGLDIFLVLFGIINAIACGAGFPLMFVLFGDVTRVFTIYQMSADNPLATEQQAKDDFWEGILDFTWKLCALGGGLWITHYIFVTCLNYSANRQVLRMRKDFFQAVMRQDIAWYDTNTTTDFASRMTEDLNRIQDGMGEKMGMFLRFFLTFILAFTYAFIQNWYLSLVLCSIVPILIILGVAMGIILTRISKNEMDTYGKAGAMAEEVLSAIRTVVAFGGQEKEVDRYSVELRSAERNGIIRGILTGVTMGLMFGVMYGVYGLGFWFGVKLIADDQESEEFQACNKSCVEWAISHNDTSNILNCINDCFSYDPGTISTALFGILQGGMQIGQSATFAEAFNSARGAAANIFKVIDRVSEIDSSSFEGIHPDKLIGNITFKNVFFNYPSRKDVNILQGLNLEISQGTSVALVGSSGCGKSTCIQLIQRFYDVDSGLVEIDGMDVKTLNVGWLRENIGIVGQEPVLFDCSIRENIQYANPEASEEEIWNACKEANAYNFIMKLPKKLDTMVGEGGAQLSGGQKQRIAIARALIRDPKILLLDEATSALDNESEGIVQAALDKVQSGRTTVIVAHRLTTIKNADEIFAFENGQVKERGSHSELMKKEGLYYNLVMRQLSGLEELDDKASQKENEIKRQRVVSISSAHEEEVNSTEVTDDTEGNFRLFMKLLSLNSPEWFYLLVGFLCATAFGSVNVFFAILFGDVMSIFSENDVDTQRSESVRFALMYGGLGLGCLVAIGLQSIMFAISGEKLTKRVRIMMFDSMLKQEVGWFDEEENNTGALCSRLSANARAVQGATGTKVGQIMQGVATLILSFGLGLYYNWKVGLVSFAFIPFLIVGMLFQMILIMNQAKEQNKALEKSSKFAIEAITNIRTVAGLCCEKKFQQLYYEELLQPYNKTKNQAHFRGMVFGFANSSFCFAYATCFAYGGIVYMEEKEPKDIMEIWKIAIAVLNGAMFVGMAFSFVMDFNLAFAAADKIFKLLNRKPKIDANKATGLQLSSLTGNVQFSNAEFSYPTRQNVQVLKKLQLSIKSGEKIALVGQSGCGKSTVIQLIQRLYDLDIGSLDFEGSDVRSLNVPNVRSNLGLVSQEPVLFNRSIADNIKYGDNSRVVSMEEVIAAARSANIHSFVSSLPQGYETSVGGKGTQLSGGQKQRVAIARALVRNPKILLLDEATSALDTESEKVVQDALDSAQEGRTSITIAHRLSTIVNVDTIFILDQGVVSEYGSHSELLERKGIYYNLWHSSPTK